MRNGYNKQQICLMNQIRKVWEQHVYWTRFFIISTAADLGDLKAVTNRLLKNPKDLAQIFAPFYGSKIAEKIRVLFTEHLTIGAELVNAAKNQEEEAANTARKKWYNNADEIAAFLSSINPCWSDSKWKAMLYSHLEMTEKEASLRLQGNYAADIEIFGKIEDEILMMADYMFYGIIKHLLN